MMRQNSKNTYNLQFFKNIFGASMTFFGGATVHVHLKGTNFDLYHLIRKKIGVIDKAIVALTKKIMDSADPT